jgi:hypothetical protein
MMHRTRFAPIPAEAAESWAAPVRAAASAGRTVIGRSAVALAALVAARGRAAIAAVSGGAWRAESRPVSGLVAVGWVRGQGGVPSRAVAVPRAEAGGTFDPGPCRFGKGRAV